MKVISFCSFKKNLEQHRPTHEGKFIFHLSCPAAHSCARTPTIHTHARTPARPHACSHTRTHARTHTHTRTNTRTHASTHARMDAHARGHKHTQQTHTTTTRVLGLTIALACWIDHRTMLVPPLFQPSACSLSFFFLLPLMPLPSILHAF